MNYGLVNFLGGLIPFAIVAAVFFYILWGVIRSAVLSALRKHASEQALPADQPPPGIPDNDSGLD